ncbi:hypothetical protein [Glutamicibacter sp. NPDC087344]|uniref:hypothetical protein n=1 Tax=Glutamicibacter sp. NPDC087344 TaxID=3363994 RepID=UPI00380EE4BD
MSITDQRGISKTRTLILIIVAVLVLGAAGIYSMQAFSRYQERTSGVSAAALRETMPSGDRIVFRNTAMGEGYGTLAAVALDAPGGERALTGIVCDRVAQRAGLISCMRTQRGIPTTFHNDVLDTQGDALETLPLPGIPSRTRISDGGLVATTSFVTGHSYAAGSFSTETTVTRADGTGYGNLEEFTMMVDGKELTAVDRNVWGVSFVSEDEFYVTVASGGSTWLMHGSFSARTLTSVHDNAECPSVSPDRTRVAYKKRTGSGATVHWDIAVLDLKTGQETIIGLRDGFDDQLEWLDDDRLLFGVPRVGEVGDSDVYVIDAQPEAEPELLIEHAWSPSVVRASD